MTTEKENLLKSYDYVGEFCEGLAKAEKNGEHFHIRPNGQPAYEERFEFVDNFEGGLALVRKDRKYFHIRPDGVRSNGQKPYY